MFREIISFYIDVFYIYSSYCFEEIEEFIEWLYYLLGYCFKIRVEENLWYLDGVEV